MKKTFVIGLIAAMAMILGTSTGATAQTKGQQAVGVQLVAGIDGDYADFGIGVKYQYTIFKNFRIEPSTTFFPMTDHRRMVDIGCDVQYLIGLAKNLNVYPVLGYGLTNIKIDGVDGTKNYSGVTFGVGGEYSLTSRFAAFTETVYRLTDSYDHLSISLGLAYKF